MSFGVEEIRGARSWKIESEEMWDVKFSEKLVRACQEMVHLIFFSLINYLSFLPNDFNI